MSSPPPIECDQAHASVAVPDLQSDVDFYTRKLGFKLAFTWGEPPSFAGLNLGSVQFFLQTGDTKPSADSPTVYFLVDDADALYEFHRANGVQIVREIDDRPYEIRDYTIRDLNGYLLVFGRHLHSAGPPVPVKRVDVPVRIEKRLAALLEDLARHKHMTLGSCLEEMILHTNEGAGPHTRATLRFIQELKAKHGIDYDCHASYRFVEE